MQKVTIFRADDYDHNHGELQGFFSTLEEAEGRIERETSCKYAEKNFSQITEFKISKDALEGVELSDTDRMLEEDIWGAGEIIRNHYYI